MAGALLQSIPIGGRVSQGKTTLAQSNWPAARDRITSGPQVINLPHNLAGDKIACPTDTSL